MEDRKKENEGEARESKNVKQVARERVTREK